MSIIQDIITWAQGLPAWQIDAIARLLSKPTLSPDDLEDIFALLKVEHGISDPKSRTAKKLDAGRIPPETKSTNSVVLLAMKNLRHVNAIAENERLTFAPEGLTIIYGDNGSGKSGYSRVLKHACRARDQKEQIHPNANLPTGNQEDAEAVFELNINGTKVDVPWTKRNPAPDELSSLAIFDSRCARAYLDEEDDFAYVPYGLDILEELARTCKQLEELTRTEQSKCIFDKTVFEPMFEPTTQVGKLILKLSEKTEPLDVEQLATVNDKEKNRFDELRRSLSADNPKEKAIQLRHLSTRISKIAKTSIEKLSMVNKAVEGKLLRLANLHHTSKATAELAKQDFTAGTKLLPGTGGEAWKAMFEAARTFCREAYPDKNFPNLSSEEQCPFCQQPLKDATHRLLHFDDFIRSELETKAQLSKKAYEDEYSVLITQSLILGLDDELFAEIEASDRALANSTRDFEKALVNRQKTIKMACDSKNWERIEPEPTSPVVQLQALADRLMREATNLDKASNEKFRVTIKAEFDELYARLELEKIKPAILSGIENLKLRDKLEKCLGAVKTNAITLKSKELAEKVISKELADALNEEFKALGSINLKVNLQSRSAKAKALHKLKLELPQAKSLGDILSEGEQRSIAIGSFLAEINIGGKTGGIVFDDPVSSLDHERRERVVQRFVREATKRQVIIFTHDIYFLFLLIDEAKRAGIDYLPQSLWQSPKGFGIPDLDIPFEGKHTKERVATLRNKQQEISRLYKAGDKAKYREETLKVYRQLRDTWERAVEEVLFRSVVLRFRKGVSTQLLAGVIVEDADYAIIEQGMTKCSKYSHDSALMSSVSSPDPDELLIDINNLEEWRSKVEERTSDLIKKRKI